MWSEQKVYVNEVGMTTGIVLKPKESKGISGYYGIPKTLILK